MANIYPQGAVPVVGTAVGTTGAVQVTLPAAAGRTTYVTGMTINSAATAGTSVSANLSLNGNSSAALNFIQPVGALTADVGVLDINFSPPLPATAGNTTIVLNTGAPGAGGLIAANLWGYQL